MIGMVAARGLKLNEKNSIQSLKHLRKYNPEEYRPGIKIDQ